MAKRLRKCSFAIVAALVLGSAAGADAQSKPGDWPQWRGPNRDGVTTSFNDPKSWPKALSERWRIPIGLGYANPLLVGDRLFMFSRLDGDEVLQALDAATGKSVWKASYPVTFTMNRAAARHGEGPKSTPTFSAGRIFTLGMTNIVAAFDAATGKLLWQTKATEAQPLYHTAQSPIVERGLVIVHVGGHNKGSVNAYDVASGAVKWSWTGDGPSYGSAMIVDVSGTRQIVVFSQENLVGVDAATGALLWQRPFTTQSTQNAITPILYDQMVIVSGLGKPITAFRIVRKGNEWATEDVWENAEFGLYMSNAVLVGDAVCGMSHRNSGQFFCLDAKTGKTQWMSEPRQATNAAVVRAGNYWFALKDDAEMFVFRAGASTFEPIARYTVAKSATWAQPVIAGNRVFVKDVDSLALWTW